MNEEELNKLYELLDASYTANCMLISNELAGFNDKIALFSSFATGGFFLARNIHNIENLDEVIRGNIGINLVSQVSELLSCYSIIIFALRSPDKNRAREFFDEFLEIFEPVDLINWYNISAETKFNPDCGIRYSNFSLYFPEFILSSNSFRKLFPFFSIFLFSSLN